MTSSMSAKFLYCVWTRARARGEHANVNIKNTHLNGRDLTSKMPGTRATEYMLEARFNFSQSRLRSVCGLARSIFSLQK